MAKPPDRAVRADERVPGPHAVPGLETFMMISRSISWPNSAGDCGAASAARSAATAVLKRSQAKSGGRMPVPTADRGTRTPSNPLCRGWSPRCFRREPTISTPSRSWASTSRSKASTTSWSSNRTRPRWWSGRVGRIGPGFATSSRGLTARSACRRSRSRFLWRRSVRALSSPLGLD